MRWVATHHNMMHSSNVTVTHHSCVPCHNMCHNTTHSSTMTTTTTCWAASHHSMMHSSNATTTHWAAVHHSTTCSTDATAACQQQPDAARHDRWQHATAHAVAWLRCYRWQHGHGGTIRSSSNAV